MLSNTKKTWRVYSDQLSINNLSITLIASGLLIIVLLSASTYLYMQSPPAVAYKQELRAYFQQENANREFARLHRYHGYPAAVIVEEGKTPYFYDKRGRKVAFVYPAKRVRQITYQVENNEQYAAMTPEKEPEVGDKIFLIE